MRYFFILILLLSITACTTQKIITRDISDVSYRELLLNNEAWQKSVKSINGSTRITLDTPQYSGNFTADILTNGQDSLLLTVTGPMGIRVGKVFVGDARFVFYNQVMNQFLTGTREDFEGMNFLQFPLELTQLRSVFSAQDRFGILKKETYELRDNAFYVKTANGTHNYNIWFDPATLCIKRIEYYDGQQLLFYKEYDQFEEFDGVLFPRRISFVRPEENQGLSIYFTELELNKPVPEDRFKINISDKAKQIDLSLDR